MMMKLLLMICWIATGTCQTVPMTGKAGFSGAPMIFETAAACDDTGRRVMHTHGGLHYKGHPDFDITGYKCVPE
jgi:hypothetical protein